MYEDNGAIMKNYLIERYTMTLCLVSMACFVIFLSVAMYDIVEIVNPKFTMNSHVYERHQANDAFWNYNCSSKKERPRPPENELTKQRNESYQRALESVKRNAFQSLVQALIVLFITAIVFGIHLQIFRRTKESGFVKP